MGSRGGFWHMGEAGSYLRIWKLVQKYLDSTGKVCRHLPCFLIQFMSCRLFHEAQSNSHLDWLSESTGEQMRGIHDGNHGNWPVPRHKRSSLLSVWTVKFGFHFIDLCFLELQLCFQSLDLNTNVCQLSSKDHCFCAFVCSFGPHLFVELLLLVTLLFVPLGVQQHLALPLSLLLLLGPFQGIPQQTDLPVLQHNLFFHVL